MFSKDAITNWILVYIIKKCTCVHICLHTFGNSLFLCALETPWANYSSAFLEKVQQCHSLIRTLGSNENAVITCCHSIKFQFKSLKVISLRLNGTLLFSLQQMLIYEPTNRISARNALSHRFFSDVKRSIPRC